MSIRSLSCLVFSSAFFGVGQGFAGGVTERSIGEARIVHIEVMPSADLVVLDAGYEAGLRQSMICQVSRSGESVGKLLLVQLRQKSSIALILNLTSGRSLHNGDTVAVQTVSTRYN